MTCYAQLNDSGICVAITQPGAPLIGPQFVVIGTLDASVLGKRWTGSAWVAP